MYWRRGTIYTKIEPYQNVYDNTVPEVYIYIEQFVRLLLHNICQYLCESIFHVIKMSIFFLCVCYFICYIKSGCRAENHIYAPFIRIMSRNVIKAKESLDDDTVISRCISRDKFRSGLTICTACCA